MLDDHAVSYGRQTNGKYIILLMRLALASLLGAWAMEHKGEVQSTLARLPPETQQPMDWQDAPSNGASSVFGCKDGAVLLTDGTLYHLNMDGAVTALLETGEDLLTPLSGSLPGAWGQSALYLWKDGAFSEIPVETGILGACANENFIAVISKGSGYLTCTKIMNAAGETLGTIGLTDAAMTELACIGGAVYGQAGAVEPQNLRCVGNAPDGTSAGGGKPVPHPRHRRRICGVGGTYGSLLFSRRRRNRECYPIQRNHLLRNDGRRECSRAGGLRECQ